MLDWACVVGREVCLVAGVRDFSMHEGGEGVGGAWGGGVVRMGTPLGVEGDC